MTVKQLQLSAVECDGVDHIMEAHRDVCFRCGRTMMDIIDHPGSKCEPTVEYLDWLRARRDNG